MFALAEEPAIGLPPLTFSDGPTGVRGSEFTGGEQVVMFPSATVAASTWSEEALEALGDTLALEALRQGVDVVLGPTVNLHRTPLGGRLFEAYSEDPLLSGRLAAAYVRGMQRRGVGASLKHFVANEAETERHDVDSVVPPDALRELYLLPYEICVADASPWTVMAAYNAVNGVPATEHGELLNGVLKDEWGYDGLVMSDWFATRRTEEPATGGLDLVMPGPQGPWGEALVAAVRAGRVAESVVDDHVTRVLRLASRVGAWHPTPGAARVAAGDVEGPASPARREQLRAAAAAGATVLTGSAVVGPADAFTPDAPLVLVGRHAVRTTLQGGGSAQVWPPHRVDVEDGLRAALADGALVVVDGVEVRERAEAAGADVLRDPETGAPGLRATSFGADGSELASEVLADPRVVLGFGPGPHSGARWLELAATVHVDDAHGVEVGVIGAGRWTLTHQGTEHTAEVVLPTDDPGAGILTPPSWSTAVAGQGDATLVARVEPTGTSPCLYALVARPAPRRTADVVAEAVEQARGRRAVVVVGLTDEQETEAADKTTLALPGDQDELVRAVAAVAASTTVVVNAATPVLLPWLDDVAGVVVVGLPGQEGGDAVADVLLGVREATGRLVTTWPARDGAGPAWETVPTGGRLVYAEGTAVGYRGWYGAAEPPAFWLGHGLGWSTWAYESARVEPDGAVAVRVRNTGARTAREVVQVYLDPVGAPVRLVGWAVAADVAPGEHRDVVVRPDPRVLRTWDTAAGRWRPLPAGGELLVARGLGDVRLRVPRVA
ncbi:family 3 glycosyl hydrolase [Kineococcus sp. R8]|nr:glycoside hydrolase family 3 N-terminal domain-containing protein [Kineococcus siccus]NAZ81325.1 family 3 glycosyl hydrolase [Kineococcus siccus]